MDRFQTNYIASLTYIVGISLKELGGTR